jgi:hypothetical protein
MKPRIESVKASGDRAGEALVVMDPGTSNSREVTLRLVLTSDGWRVADVKTKEEPSLLEALRRSNAAQSNAAR